MVRFYFWDTVSQKRGEKQNEKIKASDCRYDGWNLMCNECFTAALHIRR